MPLMTHRRRHPASLAALVAVVAVATSSDARPDAPAPLVAVEARLDRPIVLVDVASGSGAPGRSAARHAYLRLRVAARARAGERPAPLNLAIVVDRAAVREPAVSAALDEVLGSLTPSDVAAVVEYGDVVEVRRPADGRPVAGRTPTVPTFAAEAASVAAPGASGANLFGGVAKGAAEIRKYLGSARVSHLLVVAARPPGAGPRDPRALGELGAALARDGIGITVVDVGARGTLALKALAGGGGGAYLPVGGNAVRGQLREALRAARAVRARDVGVEIRFPGAVAPMRVLGAPSAEVMGRVVRVRLGDVRLTGGGELLARLDTTLCEPGRRRIGEVHVRYFDMHEAREVASVTPLEVTCAVGERQGAQVDFDVTASVAMALGEDARTEARRAVARGQTEQAALALAVALEELRELVSGPLAGVEVLSLIDALESEVRALRDRSAREDAE